MKFFDSLRQGASDAAFEAQRLLRVQRQQSVISGLQKEWDAAALDVGRRAVEKAREGALQDADLMPLAQSVLDLDTRIRDAERELDSIKAEQPPKEDQPASAPTPAAAATSRTCPNCGNPVREEAAFCTNCGTKLPQEQVPSAGVNGGAAWAPPLPAFGESPQVAPDIATTEPRVDASPPAAAVPFSETQLLTETEAPSEPIAMPPPASDSPRQPAPAVTPPPTPSWEQPPEIDYFASMGKPRTCANCGAEPTGAEETCSNCGEPIAGS